MQAAQRAILRQNFAEFAAERLARVADAVGALEILLPVVHLHGAIQADCGVLRQEPRLQVIGLAVGTAAAVEDERDVLGGRKARRQLRAADVGRILRVLLLERRWAPAQAREEERHRSDPRWWRGAW